MNFNGSGRRGPHSYRLYSFLIFFVFVLAALVLVGSLSYRQNQLMFQDFVRETNRAYVVETGRLLDRLLYQISLSSAALSDRPVVLGYVGSDDDTTLEENVRSLLSFVVSANQNVTTAAVYSGSRRRIVSNVAAAAVAETHDTDWIGGLSTLNRNEAVLVFRRIPTFETPIVSVLRRIDADAGPPGGIIINVPVDNLRRAIGSTRLHINDDFVILNAKGEAVFSFDDNRIGRPLEIARQGPFVQSVDGSLFNLTHLSIRDSGAFNERLFVLRRYLALLILVVSVSASIIAFVLAGIAYRPIREIVDTIEHPKRQRRSIPGDDIRFIEDTIVRYIASNSRLEERLSERFENLRRANYVALQLQMNPHFLYNTLDSLYWNSLEAYAEDSPVPQSLASLSRLLRYLLDTDEMAIRLEDEVRLTEQYINLLKIRFGERIAVEWSVPTELRDHLVPKLLIQPLVENAYYHGIKPLRRPGRIRIAAEALSNGMAISVSDDGIGIGNDDLASLRVSLETDVSLSGRNIGIRNVAQRLRIMFGDNARFLIESRRGDGTTVTAVVPDSAPHLATG